MRALQFERNPGRYAAAVAAGNVLPGAGARVGPLRLRDIDPPELPGPDWLYLKPRLSGICGSDLSTIDGHVPRYFEPIVSFPFVPGHEVVADRTGTDGEDRVVLEPVLGCAARNISPACAACARGDLGNCERIAFGDIEPGLQTGFCCDTGGGWSTLLVAHTSQVHPVPDDMSDSAAVMVEPTACGVHGALAAGITEGDTVVVLGSGTLGLLTLAAVRAFAAGTVIAVAKHPVQQELARRLGADQLARPGELARAVRRTTGTLALGDGDIERLCGGADVVIDCVGTEESLAQALAVVRPRGRITLVGMPGHVHVDLTGLWQREINLVGAYAYGTEDLGGAERRTFDLAFELVRSADLGALVSATYPLRRYPDAIAHAAGAGARGAVKIAFDLTVEKERSVPRPGFVLDVDRSTPPVLFHHGESFRLEKLPPGRSRIVYPAEPLEPLEHPDRAIRHALLNPHGDSAPLPALLRPGMKLTIAFDDISLPLPPMRRPDIRQRVIEQVLDMAAAAGVDDVELIAALALHRRMTEDELRHAVGDRVYDAFAPEGLLTNHDAEDPDNLAFLGTTDLGEEVEINRRAAESDLVVYVNINLVAMDGGWKSTATGLASYRSLRHHHNVHTMQHSRSFMDRHHSELHSSNWRMGKVLSDAGVKVFQIETTMNNNVFGTEGPMSVLQKREWEWSARDRVSFLAMQRGLDLLPSRQRRSIFQSWRGPHAMTSVQAGEVEAVHEVTTQNVFRQHLVPVEGQTDILTMGLPYICPYNVNSIMNPILVMCLGLGYFFNLYRGRPPVREGGVLIMSHPTPWEFHPVHHPSYIDFFEQVLAETTDPVEVEARFEKQFAEDEWYRHLYRTSHAYHGVHPFYMWYWGAHALQHLGQVIVVGGDVRAVRRLGFKPASTLPDALEMASDVVGRDATITHLHNPPILMADVT